jgi:hypothetical protein
MALNPKELQDVLDELSASRAHDAYSRVIVSEGASAAVRNPISAERSRLGDMSRYLL